MAEDKKKQAADEMAADNELLRNQILRVQLETAQIGLDQQKQVNEAWHQKEEERKRGNRRRQAQFAGDRRGRLLRQRMCAHRQGGHAATNDPLKGKGDSALTRSQVFFRGNYLIQCNRCELAVQRPHPLLKKIDKKLYEAAMAEYELLTELSESNDLQPMEGTTFSFTNDAGLPVWPKIDPNASEGEEIPRPELLGITSESRAYLQSKNVKLPRVRARRLSAIAVAEED